MMVKYIDREYLLSALNVFRDNKNGNSHFINGIETAKEIIENAPTADVAPVVHAKWEWVVPCRDSNGRFYATCPACKTRRRSGDYGNYCPLCGVKMDLED